MNVLLVGRVQVLHPAQAVVAHHQVVALQAAAHLVRALAQAPLRVHQAHLQVVPVHQVRVHPRRVRVQVALVVPQVHRRVHPRRVVRVHLQVRAPVQAVQVQAAPAHRAVESVIAWKPMDTAVPRERLF